MAVYPNTYPLRDAAPNQQMYSLLELAQGKGGGLHCQVTIAGSTPGTFYAWETLCDPVTFLPVLVRFAYQSDGTLLPTAAFNMDGTAYGGSLGALVSCSQGFDVDIQEDPWCDSGVQIIRRNITISQGGVVTSVIVQWTDLAGVIIPTPVAPTAGDCDSAPVVLATVIDSYNLPIGGASFITQAFTDQVNDITVVNMSDDTVSVVLTLTGPVTGNQFQYVPKGGQHAFRLENNFATNITVTNLAGTNGGQIIINAMRN